MEGFDQKCALEMLEAMKADGVNVNMKVMQKSYLLTVIQLQREVRSKFPTALRMKLLRWHLVRIMCCLHIDIS